MLNYRHVDCIQFYIVPPPFGPSDSLVKTYTVVRALLASEYVYPTLPTVSFKDQASHT
jgi:hypothetical protein